MLSSSAESILASKFPSSIFVLMESYVIPHNVSFSRVHYITHYKSRCGSYGGKVTHSLSPATDASPSDHSEGGSLLSGEWRPSRWVFLF